MKVLPKLKIDRADVKPGEFLCDYCTAKCCRYFALPIERPKDVADFDFMRWYLLHEQASVFIEDGTWYLLVHTRCKHLQPDNRCGIYETRPQICRDYHTDDCEYEDHFTYESYFETAEQVSDYIEARFHCLPNSSQFRSAKPNPFPIIQ